MVDSALLIWLFFRFTGRVSRAAYFLAGMFMSVILALPYYRSLLHPEGSPAGQMWQSIFLLMLIPGLWSQAALGVKRLHDLGRPGILSAALFIPFVSIVAFIALCVMRGQPGPNQYGDQVNAPD